MASAAASWQITSAWDGNESAGSAPGSAFSGNGTESAGFSGVIGSECLVDVSSDRVFPCGAGSLPFCPAPSGGQRRPFGWEGGKLRGIVLASMPHAGSGTPLARWASWNCLSSAAASKAFS